eukprot:GFUD01104225.1.p1 GENE.GFUD01104225.1~~GFUD01104225.1.p1  ORF type:complete len:388 (+),score=81.38 GFUD01104225.1:95-1258(+)
MSSTLCLVCGDMATSYSYGVRVCHSCRVFFRRTSMKVDRGKMKRALFCCLRGGDCAVDVNNRKKCNFCRFEKCKLKGMVPIFREHKESTKTLVKEVQNLEKNEKISDKLEICEEKQPFILELLSTSKRTFPYLPRTVTYQFGVEDVGKVHFFLDLLRVQKVVRPIGLPNIIPIVECSKNRKPLPHPIVKTLVKILEHWWSQFCNGLEEFQGLNPEEKKIVLANAPLADRLIQGLYLGPGSGQNLFGFIKGISDKTELETVENYMVESKISSTATIEYEQFRSSPWNKSPENERIHLVLSRKIVTWGKKGVDDISELLTCLLILFSQEPGGQFSRKIGQLYDCWRFVLWSYLDSQDLVQDTKQELFNGALSMVGITKEIWRIEQNCLD